MTNVLMPKLGLVMKEGLIGKWLKKVGDLVREGEPLLEITSEKVTTEIESPATGVLLAILAPEGTTVAVGGVIGKIGAEGEADGDAASPAQEVPVPAAEAPAAAGEAKPSAAPAETASGPFRASPAAKKLAAENGVDLSRVPATRADGVVSRADVRQYIDAGQADAPAATPLAKREAERAGVDLATVEGTGARGKVTRRDVLDAAAPAEALSEGVERDDLGRPYTLAPFTPLRSIMSRRMNESARTCAPCTITMEVEMSGSRDFRALLPFKASYTAIMAGAVARSLMLHPDLNASVTENVLKKFQTVNLGIAVDTPNGLVVPSIEGCQRKNLRRINEELADLAARARDNKLGIDELTRGTFTVTNLGMFGVDRFTPVINLPEAAILGVGKMNDVVVEREGRFESRPFVSLSLTFDHRVIDGASAARFLASVKEHIENPYLWAVG